MGDKQSKSVKIGLGVFDHFGMGGCGFSASYNPKTYTFDQVASQFVSAVKNVCPEGEAVCVRTDMVHDVDLAGNKVARYWFNLQIEDDDQRVCLVYHTNEKKHYNLIVREALYDVLTRLNEKK